jgi:hypothetical protein
MVSFDSCGIFIKALANEVTVVESGRLVTLLEDAIKWQQHQGLLKPDTQVDLFRGVDQVLQVEQDAFAKNKYATIKVKKVKVLHIKSVLILLVQVPWQKHIC